MTLPREEVLAGLNDELGRFEELIRSLGDDQWQAPTRCEGWTVGDVCAHVTGTMAYKQRRDTLASLTRHFDFAENINLKAVDHIDGRPAIRQLTARRLADVVVHECWSGPCTKSRPWSSRTPGRRSG